MVNVGKVYAWMERSSEWIREDACDGVVLSQYGDGRGFPDKPRFQGQVRTDRNGVKRQLPPERDLSMIEGRLSAVEVFRAVRSRRPRGSEKAEARVRHVEVKRLWPVELGTFRSPSRNNPSHCSVVPDPRLGIDHQDLAAQEAFWDDRGSQKLNSVAEEGT